MTMFNSLSHFVSVFDYNNNQIQDRITSFKYKYDEEGDDICEMTLESDSVTLSDKPEYAEGKRLKVQWGWLNGKKSPIRKVWIWDTKDEYQRDGVNLLTLTCHDLFALAKLDLASNKNITQIRKGIPLVFSTAVLGNLAVDIDSGNTDLANLLKEGDINLHGVKGKDFGAGNVLVSYFNGNMSTFYGLRNYLDRLPGGPYVMDSRDDRVLIRTRNFQSKAKFSYQYKAENGQLLSFIPETKNRSKKRSSEKQIVVTWNHDAKEAATIVSQADKNKGIVLANGKSLDLSTLSKSLADLNKPFGSAPLSQQAINQFITTGTKNGSLTTIDYHSELRKIQDAQKLKQQNQAAPGSLLSKVLLSSKGPGNNNTNDPNNEGNSGLTSEQVSDKLIVTRGKLPDGTLIAKLFLGDKSGVDRGTHETVARDVTAVASKTYALVLDDPGSARNNLSNEDYDHAKAWAENMRKNAELENHPATMELMGEPQLECGDIVSISNVATKNSGNYYIKECEHVIDDDGFYVHVEKAVRHGINTYKPNNVGSKDLIGELIPNTKNFGDIKSSDFQVLDDGLIINVSKGQENTSAEKTTTINSVTPDQA